MIDEPQMDSDLGKSCICLRAMTFMVAPFMLRCTSENNARRNSRNMYVDNAKIMSLLARKVDI